VRAQVPRASAGTWARSADSAAVGNGGGGGGASLPPPTVRRIPATRPPTAATIAPPIAHGSHRRERRRGGGPCPAASVIGASAVGAGPGARASAPSSAWTNALAVGYRSSGDFARPRASTASASGPIPPTRAEALGGG